MAIQYKKNAGKITNNNRNNMLKKTNYKYSYKYIKKLFSTKFMSSWYEGTLMSDGSRHFNICASPES